MSLQVDTERGERLQKVMAAAGVASRRVCEQLIAAGRVQVNGQVVTRLGIRVDPERDEVRVDGVPLPRPSQIPLVYYMMHKPVGVVTTMRDPQGRPTVADLLPRGLPRVFPVGRLDWDSSGLLLLTNDGESAARLLHPRYHVEKTYLVEVIGRPSEQKLEVLRRGIVLADGRTAPARVRLLASRQGMSRLELTLYEGRKRQVRRMLAAIGHPVTALHRVRFGPLRLGSLPPGVVRPLAPEEIAALKEAISAGERREGMIR